MLLPPGNVAVERELHRRLPVDVAMHCNRLSRPNSSLSEESLLKMACSVERAACDLAQTYPEVIIYACTSGTFLGTTGSETAVTDTITAVTGIRAIATSTAVWQALQAVGATRTFMVTPYPDEINYREIEFLKRHGIKVSASDSFRCATSEEIREIDSRRVKEMLLHHRKTIDDCNGIFISCTQLFSMDQIASIEQALNRPVVSSNQANLWAALRYMKIDSRGLDGGSLLEKFGCPSL